MSPALTNPFATPRWAVWQLAVALHYFLSVAPPFGVAAFFWASQILHVFGVGKVYLWPCRVDQRTG